MSNLPIRISSFETLRKNNCLYLDRTGYIHRLVDSGQMYFLCRPDGFGKSLFLSTLEAFFRGQRELFRGLSIERTESRKPEAQQWIEYPVLTFDLSDDPCETDRDLERKLGGTLEQFEKRYVLPPFLSLFSTPPSLREVLPVWLRYCLEKGAEVTGRPVVALVDGYDRPLLENLFTHPPQAENNRQLLESFFCTLKDEDRYLRFVFFTGVTKPGGASVSGDLNRLEDISLTQEYSGICGITPAELRSALGEELRVMADANHLSPDACLLELTGRYGGYRFAAEGGEVYSPLCLFAALSDRRSDRLPLTPGIPASLLHRLCAPRFTTAGLDRGVRRTERALWSVSPDTPDPVPLLWQLGYLTIAGFDRRLRQYRLTFPNREVRESLAARWEQIDPVLNR